MIELRSIEVSYGALPPLSLAINEGEWITVIGSNGAGKSTLLNVIAGEAPLKSGQILIDGAVVNELAPHHRAASIARVFQDPASGTFSELTIAENLALAEKRGAKRFLKNAFGKADRDRYRQLLLHFKLPLHDRLDTPVSQLSGGQRQALSLLMATLSPAKILLLDEHTAALDPKMTTLVMELTQQLVLEKKLTVLMVTHSLHQALRFGDRLIMLHEGSIIFDAKNSERANLTIDDLLHRFGMLL